MKTTRYIQLTAIVLTGICVLAANPAFARELKDRPRSSDNRKDNLHKDNHRSSYTYRNHPHYGYRVNSIPRNFINISFGGIRFYYDDGLYYRRYNNGYVLVEPPRGVRVKRIPIEYRPIVYNGITYYTDSGIYYVYTPSGYQVVPPPAIYTQAENSVLVSAPSVITQHAATTTVGADQMDMYTVNIPNDKTGGYTEVVIKKTDKGFLGPQGEFYSEFPSVEQLKVMYLKKVL